MALSAISYGTGDRLDPGSVSALCREHGALFVVDVKREIIAIKEARKLGIPAVVAIPGVVSAVHTGEAGLVDDDRWRQFEARAARHDLMPGDVEAASYVLGRTWHRFPAGTVHVSEVELTKVTLLQDASPKVTGERSHQRL